MSFYILKLHNYYAQEVISTGVKVLAAGLETMPVIVRELDDDAAAILVVDSTSQREGLFPSERAFTYKLKLEALRQSARKQI